MGSNFVSNLSALNKEQSFEDRLETLGHIERAVEGPTNRNNIVLLRELGHVGHLLENLLKPEEAIVDMALKIIARCCIKDYDFSREAMSEEHDFLVKLQHLINVYPKRETTVNEVLDILAQICKYDVTWINLILNQYPDFVVHATESIARSTMENVSEDTLVKTLRFLRLLLYDTPNDNRTQFILERYPNVMIAVSYFFIDMTLKTEINENILWHTIKLINSYSQFDIHDGIISTRPAEWIMYLNYSMNFFLQRIPRIMSHYVNIDQVESGRHFSDICDWIIEKAMDLDIEDSKDDIVGYICCLCVLLMENFERRHEEFLPELIKLIKFVENPTYADLECFILILVTFNKTCVFGDRFAQCLIDCGLLQTLIEKLKWMCDRETFSFDFDHQMIESYFVENSELPRVLGPCNHPNPRFIDENSASSRNDNVEMYSENELGCPCTDRNVMDKMKKLLLREILDLFHTYVMSQSRMPELATEEWITALLNSCVHFGCTYLYEKTTCRFDHLAHLMKITIIEKIHDMYQQQFQHDSSCAKCVTIREIARNILELFEETATSDGGMPKIKKGLTTGTIEQKVGLYILNIPYIFQKKSRLAHFLLKFNCWASIIHLLRDGSPFKVRIIKAFHTLAAQRLEITDPTQVDIAGPSQVANPSPNKTVATEKRVVTFKLNDGSTVQADRNLLIQKSRYFSALLKENFMESKEDEMTLHGIPVDLVTSMLNMIEHPEQIHQLVMEYDLDFLFEMIVFIERHMQIDLRALLLSYISKYRMNSKTVAAIYRWSIQLKLDGLRMNAVTFALVHSFKNSERVAMFDSVLDLGCMQELIGDIAKILEGHLKPYMQDSFDG